jgi:uncharacterized protein YjiK
MKKLIQNRCLPSRLALIVCAATLLQGCDLQRSKSPEGYDFEKPQKFELGKVLNEISGISYNLNDSSLLAISDSKKKIFEISLKRVHLRDYTPDILEGGQDLEDIVNMEKTLYVLSSKGTIYEIPLNAGDTVANSYSLFEKGKNDFETLYYDTVANGLIMMCKSCASDKGQQRRSAYKFDLATKTFDTVPYFSISTVEIRKLMKNDDAKFDPSAAAIHPVNKRLYILSSAGNLMVIADARGKPIEGYNLNPDDHPQAEGIAFAPNGDMYITNEGKYGRPTLQIFRYNTGKKK